MVNLLNFHFPNSHDGTNPAVTLQDVGSPAMRD